MLAIMMNQVETCCAPLARSQSLEHLPTSIHFLTLYGPEESTPTTQHHRAAVCIFVVSIAERWAKITLVAR